MVGYALFCVVADTPNELMLKSATKNLLKLERDVRIAVDSLVRFGIHSGETPDYRVFLVGKELVLAIHLDRFPCWKCGSIEKG